MQLISVELENIKRYKSAHFEFPDGIIAIAGPNGAGKTTVLEAVGYAIFGYLPYKQDDFIRRGEKNGTVKVTIRSPLDERLYTVVRSCQGQYYVYDPELKQKPVEQKADVQRWLRAHLGLSPTTDLENLFVAAVGVPQGTFTADFLKAASQRKRVFDPLLQVESYKDAADKLNDTAKVLQTERSKIDSYLAGARARLEDLAPSRQKVAELQQERETVLGQTAALTTEKNTLTLDLQRWDGQAAAMTALKQQITVQESGLTHLQQQIGQTDEQVRQATEATAVVQQHQPDFDRYVAAQKTIADLEPQLKLRQEQETKKQSLIGQQVKFTTLLETLKQQLADITAAEAERKALQPALDAWLALEAEGTTLIEAERARQADRQQWQRVNEQMAALRGQLDQAEKELLALEPQRALAETLATRQAQLAAQVHAVGATKARAASLEEWQGRLAGGTCPFLAATCLNLADGQSLDQALGVTLLEAQSAIVAAEAQVATLQTAVAEAQAAAIAIGKADGVRSLCEGLRLQISHLDVETKGVQDRLASVADLDARLTAYRERLAAMTDPRPKGHSLDAKIAERPELAPRIAKGEAMLAEVTAGLAEVTMALAESEGLMTAMTVAKEQLDSHGAGYQKVLQFQVLAQKLPALQADVVAQKARLDEAAAALNEQRRTLEVQTAAYDATAHAACRTRLTEVGGTLERLGERQRHLEAQVTELQTKVRQLEDVQVQSEEWLLQQTELDRISEFLDAGRSALRDAGPRLTQAYLANISTEANRIYREITGQGWVDLRWADDYEIVLTENGHDRPFANLSGGEQMAAALAVRLALLKEVSSLDIAFFDEPTTNLDEERRRNLAKQLPQVKGFQQLVVISHDDTFEEVTDHIVRVNEVTELVLG